MFFRRFLFLLLFHSAASTLLAQPAVVMRYDADRLRPTDSLEVVYSIYRAPATALINPQFTGWRILRGPWKRNISVTENGLTQQVAEIHYMLQPARSGQLLIPAAALRHGGELTLSNYASVEVVDATNASHIPNFSYDAYVARPGEDLKRKLTDNAFLRIRTNRQTLYEGESLIAEYLLYARVSLEASVTKRPGFNGFSSIDLKFDTSSAGFTTEAYKGQVYRVFGVRKVQLAALRAGRLKLDAFEVEARANFAVYEEGFEALGADKVVQQNALLRSNEPAITVLALPEVNKPANFGGAVGEFTISTAVEGENGKPPAVGQKAELVVSVSGKGQWSRVNAPQVDWPSGLNTFSPVITESLDSQQVPVSGTRHFRFPFVPENTGSFTIPAVAFSYFSPATRKYATILGEAQSFQVAKAPLKIALRQVRESFGSTGSIFLWSLFAVIALIALYFFIKKTTARKTQAPSTQHEFGFHGQMLQSYLQNVIQKHDWKRYEAMKMKELLENFLRHETVSAEQRAAALSLVTLCNKWVYAPEGSAPPNEAELFNALQALHELLHLG